MTDERMDARTDELIRRLDVPSSLDPTSIDRTFAMLAPRVRAARAQDRTAIGRLWRTAGWFVTTEPQLPALRPILLLGTILLLLLALLVSFVIGGAIQRRGAIDNGPLVVSLNGQLQVIDVNTGSVRAIGSSTEPAQGISRSPDGRLVAYWTFGRTASQLHVIGTTGEGQRDIATERPVQWVPNGIDTWSRDSTRLASEVMVDAVSRILVTDLVTGTSALIGPSVTSVHAPLWSPDDQWIAFYQSTSPHASLAVMRPDGSESRAISGDIGGLNAAGANNWSSDGSWVYYVATGARVRLFRANVAGGYSQALTEENLVAGAPALSPDDSHLAFIVPNSQSGWDLYAEGSEGTAPHLVLAHAENLGWSSDSQDILAQWTPTDRLGGLALVRPDGTGLRVILPFDETCQAHVQACVLAVGWGQPRP